MYVHRLLEKPLKDALSQFPVVIVTGPRQAGKSTLLQQVLQNYHYVTFDDILVRDLALKDPNLFLATYPSPLIIDKIQYVPSLLSFIKRQLDF
ncbi:MAG: AAA family ATPase [Chlamydiales bacterium]|nr:AAA family ATPase [Chlamydiales bacterium]